MMRKSGRLPRSTSGAGRNISVRLSPDEEAAIDAALVAGESRAEFMRAGAAALAKSRARAKAARSA